MLKLALQAGLQRRGHGQAADHPGGAVLVQASRGQAAIIEAVMG